MRMFQKTLSIVICFFFIYAFFERAMMKLEAREINLPKTIGHWAGPDEPRIINSENIFAYMNGAGELYLGYRFHHLEVFDYQFDNHDSILVELYFMETSDDAFGLLSLDWGGESISFGPPPAHGADKSPPPSTRALYGAGLLRIWSDNVYARVMAFRETPASRQAVLTLGQAITANRKNPPEPALLKIAPLTIDSSWKLRKDRLSFFRSFLVLNSIYYLSEDNILDLDLSAEAITAPYEHVSSPSGNKRIQFLCVKYDNQERARKALNRFHDTYLPEHKKEFKADSASKGPSLFKLEDGWLAYTLVNTYIAIVFECPDQESARIIIQKNESHFLKHGG